MTVETLIAAMGGPDGQITRATAEKSIDWLNGCMLQYKIDNDARIAAFIAQIGHESDDLTIGRENMNYSAKELMDTWPKRFDAPTAAAYAHHPEKIAAKVYANRMGNGDESSLDGWKYRGGGWMQLTGKDDFGSFGHSVGIDLITNSDMILDTRLAALSAGWEWDRGNLNELADAGEFEHMTRVINGGLIGQPDRLVRWERAKNAMGCA